MVNSRTGINSPEPYKIHFQHKRLLTALVIGLLLHVLYLAGDGAIMLLSIERRILLVIFAFRLLTMLHSSFETIEQAKITSPPGYTDWRAGLLPFLSVTPLVMVFWLVSWSTGGQLLGITGYAIAASIIMFLLILNFVGMLVKSAKEPLAENGIVHPHYGVGKFLVDSLFNIAYGLVFALGVVGLMVLSPEVLDDSIAVGSLAFYVYLMIWVVQAVIWFFSNLLRQASEDAGLRP